MKTKALFVAMMLASFAVLAAIVTAKVNFSPVVTYNDGSSIEATKTITYAVYDADTGKKLGNPSTSPYTLSADETVKCIYMVASIYDPVANSAVPGTTSDPSPTVCKKPKKLAAPTNVSFE